MKYLGIPIVELAGKGAVNTAKEISQQPELWLSVLNELDEKRKEIKDFIDMAYGQVNKIILTGAGTSAFIGLSLKGVFFRRSGIATEAIATTDLVSHPMDYLKHDDKILLISFARSGNSPESIAVVNLADNICESCFHLIITCDAQGILAEYNGKNKNYIFVLPSETNDQSLAMTSSYSSMLLSALIIAELNDFENVKDHVVQISEYGEYILNNYTADLKSVSLIDFKRAVFLGSGPLLGTVIESQLKLQELTDGKIICKADTYLGFRHGPKAVVDNTTLVVFLFSNEEYVNKYEKDLLKNMTNGHRAIYQIGISESKKIDSNFDLKIAMPTKNRHVPEEFLSVCFILPAQILAFFKSLNEGLQPDNPSKSGAISRVVQGVKIYPFITKEKKF
ncbi:MAG: SIS domain-containing protein [Bacteroidales bacterium]|nr:SIS domain-containing protein [Bacteroidales bacterium]